MQLSDRQVGRDREKPVQHDKSLKSICAEIEFNVVVLGILAWTGIRGKIIGNKAEKLIDPDLLTVNQPARRE